MTYQIDDNNPVEGQIASVFSEQVQIIREGFQNYPEQDPEGLHSARKGIKRLRAMLRLLRDKGVRDASKHFIRSLGDIGRKVSIYRDVEVLLSILEKWESSAEDTRVAADCMQLRKIVLENRTESFIDADSLGEILQELQLLESQFSESVGQHVTRTQLGIGMEYGILCLVSAYNRYVESPTTEALHDLRKSAKQHMYHQDLLAELFPADAATIEKIRLFESLMGRARDCDMVAEKIGGIIAESNAECDYGALLEYSSNERDRIMKEALSMGLPVNHSAYSL